MRSNRFIRSMPAWVLFVLLIITFMASSAGAVVYRVDQNSPTNGFGEELDWSDAAHDLQTILNYSELADGDEVWIADGEFKPHASDIAVSFEVPLGIIIKGGYRGYNTQNLNPDERGFVTILSGDLAGDNPANPDDPNNPDDPFVSSECDDNSRHVLFFYNVENPATVDGITVQYGNASGGGIHGNGGGIFIRSSELKVYNCKLRWN